MTLRKRQWNRTHLTGAEQPPILTIHCGTVFGLSNYPDVPDPCQFGTPRTMIYPSRPQPPPAGAVSFPAQSELKPEEFIRRFLIHTLPDGFHRIRHFGFMANRHYGDNYINASAS